MQKQENWPVKKWKLLQSVNKLKFLKNIRKIKSILSIKNISCVISYIKNIIKRFHDPLIL